MGRGNTRGRNGVEKPSLATRAAAAHRKPVPPQAASTPKLPPPQPSPRHPLMGVVLEEARRRIAMVDIDVDVDG